MVARQRIARDSSRVLTLRLDKNAFLFHPPHSGNIINNNNEPPPYHARDGSVYFSFSLRFFGATRRGGGEINYIKMANISYSVGETR